MPGYEERVSILQDLGDMIFKLVCDRATPEQWAEWLRAPLEHAAGTGNRDLVDKLLGAGANVGAGWRGCHGKTLLHAAAEGGNVHVITSLRRAGAWGDMKEKSLDTGHTPLDVAVIGGKEAAAKALIMAGADVNTLDATNDGPLHLAIKGGHPGIAEDLLLSGANPIQAGSNGNLPIHLAACHGLDEVVLALGEKGVDLNCLNSRGETPLRLAVRGDHVTTVKVLLSEGADPHFRAANRPLKLLHVAAKRNRAAAIPALFEAGVNIEGRTSSGRTPLQYAAICDSYAAMLALLQLGAKVNSNNSDGLTPLYDACLFGTYDAADLLLRWGADETAVNSQGETVVSMVMQQIAEAPEASRPPLERLSRLLARAPQDRAWRRRGFLVLCRAHPDRVRLAVEIPPAAAEATEQLQERPRSRARTGQVKVEVEVDGTNGGGGGAGARSGARARIEAAGEGTVGGFDGVSAWMMALTEENLFRKIVGFLYFDAWHRGLGGQRLRKS
ncbi:unnamed protein product [Ectocarpus sp. 8 AP-2014]